MRISVSDAEGLLAELVRLAEAGNDVVLTQAGEAAIRLVPIAPRPHQSPDEVKAILDRIRASAPKPATNDAARSQHLLYDEDGLPG